MSDAMLITNCYSHSLTKIRSFKFLYLDKSLKEECVKYM